MVCSCGVFEAARKLLIGDFTAFTRLKLVLSSTDQIAVPLYPAGSSTVAVSCNSRSALITPLLAILERIVTTGAREGFTVTTIIVSAVRDCVESIRRIVTCTTAPAAVDLAVAV